LGSLCPVSVASLFPAADLTSVMGVGPRYSGVGSAQVANGRESGRGKDDV
jgi:hypothetical protein